MARAFISYRHRLRDHGLAEDLATYLQERGVIPFVDTRLKVGDDWPAEIKKNLEEADFFIVFVSRSSIRSEAVRYELSLASELRKKNKLKILPIYLGRVASKDLPIDVGYSLNSIQHISWYPREPRGRLFSHLLEVIFPGGEPSDIRHPSLENLGAPFPRATRRITLEPETGAIRTESQYYVIRKADREIENLLGLQGITILLRGPGQSGKSSCLLRACSVAQKRGQLPVYADLASFEGDQLAGLEALLRELAKRIARAHAAPFVFDWDPSEGSKGNFARFMESVVLLDNIQPTLLILDNVDVLIDRSYRDDFFIAVREWHNNRATNGCWMNLSIMIGHASDPIFWITRGPVFNVGRRIWLEDFSVEEVGRMSALYEYSIRSGQIRSLRKLVGGHPFLLRQALYTLCQEHISLADLRREAHEDKGPFGDHLRAITWYLYEKKELRDEVIRLIRDERCSDEANFQKLLAAGVITGASRSEARLRCELYQAYFSEHLL
jgi:hypothetical protein